MVISAEVPEVPLHLPFVQTPFTIRHFRFTIASMPQRCDWAKSDLAIEYHDNEWGVPLHDDRALFEFLILEGAQAGLSWETILRKRDNYRIAFDHFDPQKVARYREPRIEKLLGNSGIVRNRLKIHAAIQNAKSFLAVQKEFGSFDDYVWQFVDGRPINRNAAGIAARTPISDKLSKDLLQRGFKFVGSTICYAFMQAVGMVNDHNLNCFRYREIASSPFTRDGKSYAATGQSSALKK